MTKTKINQINLVFHDQNKNKSNWCSIFLSLRLDVARRKRSNLLPMAIYWRGHLKFGRSLRKIQKGWWMWIAWSAPLTVAVSHPVTNRQMLHNFKTNIDTAHMFTNYLFFCNLKTNYFLWTGQFSLLFKFTGN